MSGDCLSKGVGGARPSKAATEKRKIIERLKPDHALNNLLHVAKMPRSSFYYKEIKQNYHEVKETILVVLNRQNARLFIATKVYCIARWNGRKCWRVKRFKV